jgi:methionyl-tRNA formyltransferase
VHVHASLLPRWRGAAPIQRAILAGDATTGITIMQMDAGLDTGPILLERRVSLAEDVTAGGLTRELAALGAAALIEALEALVSGRARPHPQPSEGTTYAAKIRKAEALIDWSLDARQIARQIRAFNPAPVAETRWRGEPLKVLAAAALTDAAAGVRREAAPAPGHVATVRSDAFLVCCGQGVLSITEVQRPGRRPVGARDFANSGLAAGTQLG